MGKRIKNNKPLPAKGLSAKQGLESLTSKLDHDLVIESLIKTHLSEGGRFDILKVKMSLAILDDDTHYNINTPTIRVEGGVVKNASLLSQVNKTVLKTIGFTLIG